MDDSDSEGECALSENWTFQRESRRWSRVDGIVNTTTQQQPSNDLHGVGNVKRTAEQRQRSQDHLQVLQQQIGDGNVSQPLRSAAVSAEDATDATLASRFRRSGSERLRDGAKAILRRVESLKTRRRKQRNRDGVVIGSPQVQRTAFNRVLQAFI